jgi:hypothetical protein
VCALRAVCVRVRVCGVTGRSTSIGGTGRSSTGTYGESVGRAFGNPISGSVMGDDSGEEDADTARLSHDNSVSDVRQQRRTEARAIQAVRAAAGLGPGLDGGGGGMGGESEHEGIRSRDSETLLDTTQSRLFDDDDAGSHISINESFSLFDDERGLQDDESAGLRERFLRSPGGTRFDTDMGVEDEVEEGGGYREDVVERLFDRLRGSDASDRGDMMMDDAMDVDTDPGSGASLSDGRGGSLGSMNLGGQGHSQTQHSVGSGVRVDRSPVISAPSSLQWSDVPGAVHPAPSSSSSSSSSSLYHTIPSMNSSNGSGFDLNAPDSSAGAGTARGGSCVVGELIAHKQVHECDHDSRVIR